MSRLIAQQMTGRKSTSRGGVMQCLLLALQGHDGRRPIPDTDLSLSQCRLLSLDLLLKQVSAVKRLNFMEIWHIYAETT